MTPSPGADPGFQVRGLHLKKLRRAKGGAKFVGVFRVKNHDFTPKNHIFSNLRGGGGARRVRPLPPGSAPAVCWSSTKEESFPPLFLEKYIKKNMCQKWSEQLKTRMCMWHCIVDFLLF